LLKKLLLNNAIIVFDDIINRIFKFFNFLVKTVEEKIISDTKFDRNFTLFVIKAVIIFLVCFLGVNWFLRLAANFLNITKIPAFCPGTKYELFVTISTIISIIILFGFLLRDPEAYGLIFKKVSLINRWLVIFGIPIIFIICGIFLFIFKNPWRYSFYNYTLLIPILEEFFFRGYIYSNLKKLFPKTLIRFKERDILSWAVLISAVLFGIYKLIYFNSIPGDSSTTKFIIATLHGLIFSMAREASSSCWVSSFYNILFSTFNPWTRTDIPI